jgi:hypothetical protein
VIRHRARLHERSSFGEGRGRRFGHGPGTSDSTQAADGLKNARAAPAILRRDRAIAAEIFREGFECEPRGESFAAYALLSWIWNRNGSNEATCVITLWMLQDLIAIADFNKFTVLHNSNSVSQDIHDR